VHVCPGVELRFWPSLYGASLKDMIEVLLAAPAAAEVVVADLTGGNFADDRVLPPGQMDVHSGDFAAVESGAPLDWLG
jgi:hypothetical protein